MSVNKIKAAVDAAEGNERAIGEVVLMIAQENPHAAEVIAADLDNKEMSFGKCFAALFEYARKHQKNGSWACLCSSYDPQNEVCKVVADFYKVELSGAPAETQATQRTDSADELDLMSLL